MNPFIRQTIVRCDSETGKGDYRHVGPQEILPRLAFGVWRLAFLLWPFAFGAPFSASQCARIFVRSRAIDWLCSWHTRDSVTPSTAAISFRFMSCS